jgi:hypothetical protein
VRTIECQKVLYQACHFQQAVGHIAASAVMRHSKAKRQGTLTRTLTYLAGFIGYRRKLVA